MNLPYHHEIPHDVLAIVQEKADKGEFYRANGTVDSIAVLDSIDFYMGAREANNKLNQHNIGVN